MKYLANQRKTSLNEFEGDTSFQSPISLSGVYILVY